MWNCTGGTGVEIYREYRCWNIPHALVYNSTSKHLNIYYLPPVQTYLLCKFSPRTQNWHPAMKNISDSVKWQFGKMYTKHTINYVWRDFWYVVCVHTPKNSSLMWNWDVRPCLLESPHWILQSVKSHLGPKNIIPNVKIISSRLERQSAEMYTKTFYKLRMTRLVISSVYEHPWKLKFEVELGRETVFIWKPTLNSPTCKISFRTQKY